MIKNDIIMHSWLKVSVIYCSVMKTKLKGENDLHKQPSNIWDEMCSVDIAR